MTTNLVALFTQHPNTAGENYFQHLCSAMSFALALAAGAVICMVHALLPFLFARTGSRIVTRLYSRMILNRHRTAPTETTESELSDWMET